MSFISYAQNMEDVILWRALKGVERGFYIDIGANDPVIDSVTKAFYDVGWNGINIEPTDQWFDKLAAQRSRDINLKVAAGSAEGKLSFYEIPSTGLSTTEKDIAKRHALEMGYSIIEKAVPVQPIDSICEEYCLNSTIHFLKIDVEGAEKSVLEGMNFSIFRPWIIVVESTLPNSQVEDYENWEHLILDSKYEYVYFDGLNRYYVAEEHRDLAQKFNAPPNVFDDFVFTSSSQFSTLVQGRLVEAESSFSAKLRAVQSELEVARYDLSQSTLMLEAVDTELQSIYRSRSWRLTAPLRQLLLLLSHLVLFTKGKVITVALRCVVFMNTHPSIKRRVLTVLEKFPFVYNRLRYRLRREIVTSIDPVADEGDINSLGVTAHHVYDELKLKIKNNKANKK